MAGTKAARAQCLGRAEALDPSAGLGAGSEPVAAFRRDCFGLCLIQAKTLCRQAVKGCKGLDSNQEATSPYLASAQLSLYMEPLAASLSASGAIHGYVPGKAGAPRTHESPSCGNSPNSISDTDLLFGEFPALGRGSRRQHPFLAPHQKRLVRASPDS